MSERDLQGFVAKLIRWNRVDGLIAFHIPNEGKRSERTGAFMKHQGMLPGAPDWSITTPGGHQHWLELKTAKGRLSPNQHAFEKAAERNGSPYAIARSSEEAAAILFAWGAIRTNPLAKPIPSTTRAAA